MKCAIFVFTQRLYFHKNEKGRDSPNALATNNAGLELTADILEEIFTTTDFPDNAMKLPVSLAASGKSRCVSRPLIGQLCLLIDQ